MPSVCAHTTRVPKTCSDIPHTAIQNRHGIRKPRRFSRVALSKGDRSLVGAASAEALSAMLRSRAFSAASRSSRL